MTTPRKGVLRRVESRLSRIFLAVGIGFIAVFLITPLVVPPILDVLGGWVQEPHVAWEVLFTLIGQLWVWAVLPVLVYGAARVLDLRPWGVPVGAALSGLFVVLSLNFVTFGLDFFTDFPARLVTVVLTTALGAWLGHVAVLSARRAAARKQRHADETAAAKKSEYDEFAREAERLAALHDQPRRTDEQGPASEG